MIVTQGNNGQDLVITLTEGNIISVDGYKITSNSSTFSLSGTNFGMNYKFKSESPAVFDVNQNIFSIESNQVTLTINDSVSFNLSGKTSRKITEKNYSLFFRK